MSKEEQARSEKLYAILVGLLRNRPLKLQRAVEGRNGCEVWRQLSTLLAPKTRSRSIALLQAFLAPDLHEGERYDHAGRRVCQGGQRGHQRQHEARCFAEGDAGIGETTPTAADD